MPTIAKVIKFRGSFNVVREDTNVLLTGGYSNEESALAAGRKCGFIIRTGHDEYIDEGRKAVLDALDQFANLTTGASTNGPKDRELAELFKGVDAILERMFKLQNESQS